MAIYNIKKDIKEIEFKNACTQNTLKYLKQLNDITYELCIKKLENNCAALEEINNKMSENIKF